MSVDAHITGQECTLMGVSLVADWRRSLTGRLSRNRERTEFKNKNNFKDGESSSNSSVDLVFFKKKMG